MAVRGLLASKVEGAGEEVRVGTISEGAPPDEKEDEELDFVILADEVGVEVLLLTPPPTPAPPPRPCVVSDRSYVQDTRVIMSTAPINADKKRVNMPIDKSCSCTACHS